MKKTILTVGILMFATIGFLSSCKNNETKTEEAHENAANDQKELAESEQDYVSDYEAFKIKINERIAANEAKIITLKEKASSENKELKAKYNKSILKLEEKNAELKVRINSYSETTKEAWELFKNDINKTADDLENEFNNFKNK